MEENESPRSPFWVQTAKNDTRIQRYRHQLSSIFFNSLFLIIFLLLFAILSIVFIIPFLIDFSSSVFKPNLVKRSWDSVNLLLVFVALVFGFLSRNVNVDEKLNLGDGFDRMSPELIAGDMAGDTVMYDLQEMSSGVGLRRQKTSSSYPDIRELSPPWNHRDTVDPWRFSDDTHLNYYRVMESNRYFRQRNTPEMSQPNETPSLPEQIPVHSVKKKKKIHHNVVKEDGERSGGSGAGKILSPGKESPEKKGGRGERKRGDGEKRRARSSEPGRISPPVIDPLPETPSPLPDFQLTERKKYVGNATKDFFTSFYHKKKKKLHRGRSVDNLGTLLHHSQPTAGLTFQLPLQSPPRLPAPPISDLDNLFPPKKEKTKKFISVTIPPPSPPLPPPPLPPPRPTIARVTPFVTEKPKVQFPMTNFTSIDDSSSGGDSPMKQIPPPPPLPPFKMPDWKFALEGDFVRLQSTLSSRSVSPDGDEAQSPSSDVDVVATILTPPQFYPNLDIDTKADSFIARFRAGLKVERMSKLGPGPYPSDC